MTDSSGLMKLSIEAFATGAYDASIGTFTVQINPASYSRNFQICYNNEQAQGSSSGTPEFNRTKSDVVEFDLVFDATGVVPDAGGNSTDHDAGIADRIDAFLKLVFDFNGSIHSPNYLRLQWGERFIFDCRMTKLNLNYTLFKPDGTPLRATAKSSFMEFTNKVKLAKEETKSSPDLSHSRTVKAGDTLPLLCAEIYGSGRYVPQVARFNNLSGFRQLQQGTTLVFPALAAEQGAS